MYFLSRLDDILYFEFEFTMVLIYLSFLPAPSLVLFPLLPAGKHGRRAEGHGQAAEGLERGGQGCARGHDDDQHWRHAAAAWLA